MLDDGSVPEFARYGGYMAIGSGIDTFTKHPSDEAVKAQREAGYFLDLWHWRGHRSNPINMSDDQVIAEARLGDAGKSSAGSNHVLTARWTVTYWAAVLFVRWRRGEAVWNGMTRWIMAGLALLGITGTLGGHLVGIHTEVSAAHAGLGWDVYTTYYVPDMTLVAIGVMPHCCRVLDGGAAAGWRKPGRTISV